MLKLVGKIINRVPPLKLMLDEKNWHQTIHQWNEVTPTVRNECKKPHAPSVLILPPDTTEVIGSRGDQAMIEALKSKILDYAPNAKIHVAVSTEKACSIAQAAGFIPEKILGQFFNVRAISDLLHEIRPHSVIAIGADIMDGFYGPLDTLKMLITADIAARMGAKCAFLGFSFNSHPYPKLKPAFERVDNSVTFHVRDPISFSRFRGFCNATSKLVADAAFCLQPTYTSQVIKIKEWISSEKSKGKIVIAVNAHSLLFKKDISEAVSKTVLSISHCITSLSDDLNVSWLLLPHDFRGNKGDLEILSPISKQLKVQGCMNFLLVEDAISAGEIKAISGEVNGVITGRMHLAIAALGMNVPAMAITYQDKFHGLYEHFNLPDWLLITPEEMLSPNNLLHVARRFITELGALKTKIQDRLPDVLKLSASNFLAFEPTPRDTP